MKGSIRNYIDEKIKELSQQHLIPDTPGLPVGYNPLEKIRGGLFHWIPVPFNKTEIWCQLRCLNQAQIEACGDISCITGLSDEEKKKPSREQLVAIRNFQEKLCRGVMNIPLFDDVAKLVGVDDFVFSEKRKELENIRLKIKENQETLSPEQIIELNDTVDNLELFLGYILPADTMDFITWWAMGNDVSDIRKITKKKYLEAALLADRNKGAPTDYLSGVFTDHNKNDINKCAWNVHAEFMEQKKIEAGLNKSPGRRFIGGPKSKGGK